MIRKRLPIGIDDFETIIEDNYYYVDKSLFIKELIDGDGLKKLSDVFEGKQSLIVQG